MKIQPERLRRLRKEKGLSRVQLARLSKVSERTIQRLEKESERTQTNREYTLECLAKGLGVEEGVLAGDAPIPDANKPPEPERVQIGAQVAPKARLAYDLVKRRYGVSATEIINMAPLFFTLLAEGSLAWRCEKLEEASDAIGRLEQLDREMKYRIFEYGAILASDAHILEQKSVDKADLFGDHLLDSEQGMVSDDPFDPAESNPFACYLRKLADDLGRPGVVDLARDDLSYGSPLKFPDYNICRDEIDAVANSSSDARRALEVGATRLTEIPEELMGENASEERAAWLEDRLPDIYRNVEGEPMAEVAGFMATATPKQRNEFIARLEEELASRGNHQTQTGRGEQ